MQGNVTGYLNADSGGSVAASYEYHPFGELVAQGGSWSSFAFGFSTQYTDRESGLVYYGLRYYDPKHGRFINRDPIEEQGGFNLYGFCANNPANAWDMLGMLIVPGSMGTSGDENIGYTVSWHEASDWDFSDPLTNSKSFASAAEADAFYNELLHASLGGGEPGVGQFMGGGATLFVNGFESGWIDSIAVMGYSAQEMREQATLRTVRAINAQLQAGETVLVRDASGIVTLIPKSAAANNIPHGPEIAANTNDLATLAAIGALPKTPTAIYVGFRGAGGKTWGNEDLGSFVGSRGGATFDRTGDGQKAALAYINATLAKNPNSPVVILGYSRGCAAAVDLASTFNSSGQAVAQLTLIDPVSAFGNPQSHTIPSNVVSADNYFQDRRSPFAGGPLANPSAQYRNHDLSAPSINHNNIVGVALGGNP